LTADEAEDVVEDVAEEVEMRVEYCWKSVTSKTKNKAPTPEL
jgi:hypothetical protein